jgi:hypothetical protein
MLPDDGQMFVLSRSAWSRARFYASQALIASTCFVNEPTKQATGAAIEFLHITGSPYDLIRAVIPLRTLDQSGSHGSNFWTKLDRTRHVQLGKLAVHRFKLPHEGLPLGEKFLVAYLSPMDFRQLYPSFASDIGEKSAPVVGLNVVFGRFR